jgi:L-ribulose-5-phosphate 3-epimerase
VDEHGEGANRQQLDKKRAESIVSKISNNMIGLYEKALPANLNWDERLNLAKQAGYDFLEISIDETDERLARMHWNDGQRTELNDAMIKHGLPILTMCLSGNRRFPIGSEDRATRETGIQLIKDAIDFSICFGIRIVQLAGYDEFYNPVNEKTKKNFIASLRKCVKYAERKSVMLAFETMETKFMDSVAKAMKYIKLIKSPCLHVYPDVGNLTATQQNIESDLKTGLGHVVAIHLKDAVVGKMRDIPFGQGVVDFREFFMVLLKHNYTGLFVAEMWTDETEESIKEVNRAMAFLKEKMVEAESEYNLTEKKLLVL